MKQIVKKKEPITLTNYRSSLDKLQKKSSDVYKNFKEKTKEECNKNIVGNLRKQLLDEQGYVCCYCMQRISCNNSRIEHFKSQSNNQPEQIKYKNLFIACNNSNGKKPDEQHCDIKKGETDLKYIDLLSNIENYIQYTKDGHIKSNNTDIDDEINKILNLNLKILVDARRQTLSDFYIQYSPWKSSNINKLINKYSKLNQDGKLAPFMQMIIFHLQKKGL